MTTAPATMPIIRRVARRPLALRTASASAAWSPASGAVPACPSRARRTGGAAQGSRGQFDRAFASHVWSRGRAAAERQAPVGFLRGRRSGGLVAHRGRLLPGGRGGRRFRLDQRQEVGDVTGAAGSSAAGFAAGGGAFAASAAAACSAGKSGTESLTEPVRLILPEAMTTSPRLSAVALSATSNTWRHCIWGQRILLPARLGSS